MNLLEKVNGVKKPIGIGTMAGVLVASVAFITLNFTLSDRLRGEGAREADVKGDIRKVLEWQEEYDRNVRPLRDQFIKFTGQLPGLIERMDDLRSEMRRLSDRLDRLEQKRPAAFQVIKDTP